MITILLNGQVYATVPTVKEARLILREVKGTYTNAPIGAVDEIEEEATRG